MSRFAFLCISVLLGSLVFACKSSDKGAATGKTVDVAASEIGQGTVHLDATLAALKDLVEKPAPDLAPQFKTYSDHLSALESSAEEVKELAAAINAKSQAYFDEWDQQLAEVHNEDIRAQSAERRQVISASFTKIKSEYSEVREEFRPLLSDLQDIRKVLASDLTMDGLKSIKGTVNDVAKEAASVKESLQELEKRFRDLGVKMSRTGPPAPAPAPAKQ